MKMTRVPRSGVAAALGIALVGGASAPTALAAAGAATANAPGRPEVAVIGLGGTIAGVADSRVGFET